MFRHNTFFNHHIACGGIVIIPLQHLNCLTDLSQDSSVFLHFLSRFWCFCHNFQILKRISVRRAIFPPHNEWQPVARYEANHLPRNVNWVGATPPIESGVLPNPHLLPYINIPLTNFLEGSLPSFCELKFNNIPALKTFHLSLQHLCLTLQKREHSIVYFPHVLQHAEDCSHIRPDRSVLSNKNHITLLKHLCLQ